MKRKILLTAAASVLVLMARSQVDNITITQLEGERLVEVNYDLDTAAITTFQVKTGGVALVHSEHVNTVTGAINRLLAPGSHTFVWNAGEDFPQQELNDLSVELTSWTTNNPPPYCDIFMVQQLDGTYPVRWYGKESEVPFGVSDARYRRLHLLLRKIPASAGYSEIGSPPAEVGHKPDEELRSVQLQPFYLGVYELTQLQWNLITGEKKSYFSNANFWQDRPVEQVSYCRIRESAADTLDPAYSWPANPDEVHPESFMGALRAKVGGLLAFDLPTEVQWEYACRAGSVTAWNHDVDIADAETDQSLNAVARYRKNGGYTSKDAEPKASSDLSAGTAPIGSFRPNAWGLYDMHGNVREWCLEWYDASTRVARGGGWSDLAEDLRSAARLPLDPATPVSSCGLRLSAPARLILP